MATGFFKKQFEDFEDFKRSDIDRHKFTLDNSSILSSSQVSVDGQIVVQISFKTGSAEYSFLLLKGIYIKRKFLAKLQLTLVPDDKDLEKEIPLLEEITLYQHFLSKSPAFIYDSDFLFNIDSRILLCQSFIELLEENNLHLSQYRDTYIALLRLNFELAEQSCYSSKIK